jgi:hypothetical protein
VAFPCYLLLWNFDPAVCSLLVPLGAEESLTYMRDPRITQTGDARVERYRGVGGLESLREPRNCFSVCPLIEAVSVRSHRETWAGCIVSLTTPRRSSLNESRSAFFLSVDEKVSRVFLASYFLR